MWIHKKISELVVGDKFVFDPDMFFWHRYDTVISIDSERVHCEDLSSNGRRKFSLKKDDIRECLIRPDAPLHLRKECLAYFQEYLNWPYNYPDKEKTEKQIMDAIQNRQLV